MRSVLVIGIGAGNPDHVTTEAIEAMQSVDVFLVLGKGDAKDELVKVRTDICDRYLGAGSYRVVEATDPPRDRTPDVYGDAVLAWQTARVELYERLLLTEVEEHGTAGILVWGDPSIYDGTLRVIEDLRTRGNVDLDHRVIPGISSVQVLAARHRITLNRVGTSVMITTGRRLAAEGFPSAADDVVVMLDSDCTFRTIAAGGIDIFWGAYLGTDDEILIAGPLLDLRDEIVRVRAEARARKGWLFDTYLLRRTVPRSDTPHAANT